MIFEEKEIEVKNGKKVTFRSAKVEDATMLIEYRSDDVECLNIMKEKYEAIFEEAKGMCSELVVDLVGDRPCMSKDIDMDEINEMADLVESVYRRNGCDDVRRFSSSTDANIPLSLGIPAICLGAGSAGKAHTTEEWVNKESLKLGFMITLDIILAEGGAL